MLLGLVSPPGRRSDRPHGWSWREPPDDDGLRLLGLRFFLLSLAVFFVAGLVAFFVLRATAPRWPRAGEVRLPVGLWASTAVLVLSSLTMHRATAAIRANRHPRFRRFMLLTTALGVAFLVLQVSNWAQMLNAGLPVAANLFVWLFYSLTALHALHVVGGLVPLTFVTGRAYAGGYSPGNYAGVRYCGMYWHFLGCVWLVLFGAMVLPV
jgi:cytochrome c oxidase subunit 3